MKDIVLFYFIMMWREDTVVFSEIVLCLGYYYVSVCIHMVVLSLLLFKKGKIRMSCYTVLDKS